MKKPAQAWGVVGKDGWLYGFCFKTKELAEKQIAIFDRVPEKPLGPYSVVHFIEAPPRIKNKKRVIKSLLSLNDKKHMARLKKAIKGLKVSKQVQEILLKIAFEVNGAWIDRMHLLLAAGMSDPTGKKSKK